VKLIVSDGVFSMDGDIAPVAALLALAERHDAWLILDDAHGLGVLGGQGRGAVEHAMGSQPTQAPTDRLILVGTLGKAVGAAGAFVVAHEELIEALLQTARPYIFTTASPPALAVAVQAALDLIESPEGQRRRARLQALIQHWRQGIRDLLARHPALDWTPLPSDTPIQPLVVRHNHQAVALSQALQARGLRVPAIRPPTVAPGSARLRITFSADHQLGDVDALVVGLEQACELI
jgi:8-amino-7-oxononanoate synthase